MFQSCCATGTTFVLRHGSVVSTRLVSAGIALLDDEVGVWQVPPIEPSVVQNSIGGKVGMGEGGGGEGRMSLNVLEPIR